MVRATDGNSLLNYGNTGLNTQEREMQIALAKLMRSYPKIGLVTRGLDGRMPANSTPFTLKRYFPVWAINYAITCKIRGANNWEPFQGRTSAKFVCYLSGI